VLIICLTEPLWLIATHNFPSFFPMQLNDFIIIPTVSAVANYVLKAILTVLRFFVMRFQVTGLSDLFLLLVSDLRIHPPANSNRSCAVDFLIVAVNLLCALSVFLLHFYELHTFK